MKNTLQEQVESVVRWYHEHDDVKMVEASDRILALVADREAALVRERDNCKKWANKLLDDIRSLEADRDSWKVASERASQSCAESAAEVERLRPRDAALVGAATDMLAIV